LLTLLVSCSVQSDFGLVLKACKVILQQVDLKSHYDETEQFMLFQLTRIWLLYATRAPEFALFSPEFLFFYYVKMVVVPEVFEVMTGK
jgi:hypothetical protein